MTGAGAAAPVGRLGVVCRTFPDNTLGSPAADLLELLPAIARTGTRVSVVCESPTGTPDDLVWRGVDLHRLALPPCDPLPVYAEAARWAQAAAEWFARNGRQAGVTVVEAPAAGAELLHMPRVDGIARVARLGALVPAHRWWDAADPAVLGVMEETALGAAALRVAATPVVRGGVESVPLVRLRVERRPAPDGPVVVVAGPGDVTVAERVRELAALLPGRTICVCGCVVASPPVEALTDLLAEGVPVVASTTSSVAAVRSWLADATALVVTTGADTGLVVDALAHGIPVVTDAPVDAELLGSPAGLRVVPASGLAAAAAEAVGDPAVGDVCALEAPGVARRWSPGQAARHILDRYAALPGRGTARSRRPALPAPSPRFAASGGHVAVALDGRAPEVRATVARLHLTGGADVSVTVVGGDATPSPQGGVGHVPVPAEGIEDLARAAAGLGSRFVLAVRGDVQLDPGWAERLDAVASAFGEVGVVGLAGSGYRIGREGGELVLRRARPGVTPCDVVLSPLLCVGAGLAAAEETSHDPVEAALRRAIRARSAGARVLQVDGVGIRPACGATWPARVVVPPETLARLAVEGLRPEGWIVDVTPADGFHPTEDGEGTPFAWMAEAGALAGDVPSAGRWELCMVCRSFAEPRDLVVAGPDGGRVALGTIPPGDPAEVRTVLDLPAGPVVLRLEVSTPPRRPCDLLPSADERLLSVSVSAALLERVG